MTDHTESLASIELARAAARRYLNHEHQVLLRTIVRDDVARAVYAEALMLDINPEGVDAECVQEAIEQLRAVRVTYAWAGEEPTCGAEPDQLGVELGCKPCSLPAGHDRHRYPWPMAASKEKHD